MFRFQIRFYNYFVIANISPAFVKMNIVQNGENLALYSTLKCHGAAATPDTTTDDDPYASPKTIALDQMTRLTDDFAAGGRMGRLSIVPQATRAVRNMVAVHWFPSLWATRNPDGKMQLERRFLRKNRTAGSLLLEKRMTIRITVTGSLPKEVEARPDHEVFRFTNAKEYRMFRKRQFNRRGDYWSLKKGTDTLDLVGPYNIQNLKMFLTETAQPEQTSYQIISITICIIAPGFGEVRAIAQLYAKHDRPALHVDHDTKLKCARFFVGPFLPGEKGDFERMDQLLGSLVLQNPDPADCLAGLPAETDDNVTDQNAREDAISPDDLLPREQSTGLADHFANMHAHLGNLQAVAQAAAGLGLDDLGDWEDLMDRLGDESGSGGSGDDDMDDGNDYAFAL